MKYTAKQLEIIGRRHVNACALADLLHEHRVNGKKLTRRQWKFIMASGMTKSGVTKSGKRRGHTAKSLRALEEYQ